MKKLFEILLFLFVLLYIYQFAFTFFSKGHTINYDIIDDQYIIEVEEKFKNKTKEDIENYSLQFNVYGEKFYFLIYDNFNKESKIVDSAKYYIDKDYSCLFVKYKNNKVISDVMCKKDGVYYPFNNIVNPTIDLVDFIGSLSREGYFIKDFLDNKDESYVVEDIQIFKNNLQGNKSYDLAKEDYLYRVSDSEKNIKQKTIGTKGTQNLDYFIKNNYLVAQIEGNNITKFHNYDLLNNKKTEINVQNISSNTKYIGEYGTILYIYDYVYHTEYAIDTINNEIKEIGNSSIMISYLNNGTWKKATYQDFESNLVVFDPLYKSDIESPEYSKIMKTSDEHGYYYYVKPNNAKFDVYRASTRDKETKTYICTTSELDHLVPYENVLFYQDENAIKYFSDKTGNRTLLVSNELKNYKFNIIKK
ncbi:MAG: hypothetical protein RR659_01195 [Bacilli bacterium]